MVTGMTNYAKSRDKNWFQGLCFSLSANLTLALRSQTPHHSSIKSQIYSGQLSKSLSDLCVCTRPISPVRPEELSISCSSTPWNRNTPSAATQLQLFLLHSLPCWEWITLHTKPTGTEPLQHFALRYKAYKTVPQGSPVSWEGFSSLLGEHPQNTHRTTAIETGRQPPTRHLGPVRGRVWQIFWGSYYIIKA